MKYPNYSNLHLQVSFCMSQNPPFLWCTSLEDSPSVHPSVFRQALGNQAVQERQALCPYAIGPPFTFGTTARSGKGAAVIMKSRSERINSLSDHCLKYRVVSSFLCFLTWRGGKVKETLLPPGLLFFMLPITEVLIGTYFTWTVRSITF